MKSLKKFFLIPLLVFFVCAASAQNPAGKTGFLLWKVSGNGLKSPSYIFGTHHLFPVSFLDSVAGVRQAFANCEQMAGELLMNDMAALAGEMQKAGMMPKDTTWQMLLSDSDYRLVNERLTEFFGVGMSSFEKLKPSMVSMTFTGYFYLKKFSKGKEQIGMDLWFQQQSMSREIPVIGLETIQDQIAAIIDVSSLKQQATDLVCFLQNLDFTEASNKKINCMYRSADFKGLEAMLREENPCPMSAEQEIALLDAPNQRWLKKLPAIMHEKSTFVAVGCMHLVGDVGLLIGLEKAGYTVEPAL